MGPGTTEDAAKPVLPRLQAPSQTCNARKFPRAFCVRCSFAGAVTVNMKSLAGDTPVGAHSFAVPVTEQLTPKRKSPNPSECGPATGAVIGPVKEPAVVLTPARLNAMLSFAPPRECKAKPDAAVRSMLKVYVVPTLVTVTVPQPPGSGQATPMLSWLITKTSA